MELRSSGRVVSSSARSPAQLAVGGEKESIRAYLHLKVRSLQTDPGREFTVKICLRLSARLLSATEVDAGGRYLTL